ncbi:MAG: hypothetical protein NT086_13640 [Proteobacteria bacterium]|nr:hypothetical protein [Pseudomonadota bacterium]
MYDIRAKEQSAEADRCKQSANQGEDAAQEKITLWIDKEKVGPRYFSIFVGVIVWIACYFASKSLGNILAYTVGAVVFLFIQVVAGLIREYPAIKKKQAAVTCNDEK